MKALALLLVANCTWARIRKVSAIDMYVCGWPDEESKARPLQCVPYEDFEEARQASGVGK